ALESLPWAIGYARTEYLVPNVGIEPRHLANSGIWAEKLDAASKGPFSRPGPTLRLDKIVSTRNTTTTGVRRKAVLYMHGGAFVTGGRFDNLPVALSLSSSTEMPVYLLDYRLAPATKYPGQLYDAYCAFRFLVDNLGYSIGDIVFAGDSAGGNLALALWQLTREPVAGLVLLSPRVDVVSARRSWKTNIEWDILPEYNVEDPGSSLAQLLEQGDRQRLEDPFLAPIHASLDALPPTLIQAGTREVMLDDIREFVRRVRLQGNTDVVYTEYAGGFHVFQSFSLGAANSVRAWKQVQHLGGTQPEQRQRVMAMAEAPPLVTARGTRLWRGHSEYYISGANYWQAMNLGMAVGESSDRARVHEDLAQLQAIGINTVRILASSEGSQFGEDPPGRLRPVLMPQPNSYNQSALHGLDWFLAQLPKYNMTAVVSLGNYWTWSGGAAQLVSWATNTSIPYPAQWDPVAQKMTAGDYQKYLDYTNRFFDPNDAAFPAAQQIYRNHIAKIIGRINTVSARPYASDPAILAWELMNEPQRSPHVGRWIADIARLIRTLDPRHLVTPGAECKDGAEWFDAMHRAPDISLASCHFWAANWGLYNATDPTDTSLDGAIGHMQRFMRDTATWAHSLDLPVALLEFGLGRDAWGPGAGLQAYQPEAQGSQGQRTRRLGVLGIRRQGKAAKGPIGGANMDRRPAPRARRLEQRV
ncbi:hypothetical protein LPJ56_002781, partial [Coemansia sp. RSA 2599]